MASGLFDRQITPEKEELQTLIWIALEADFYRI
jgi:hypothetical protein